MAVIVWTYFDVLNIVKCSAEALGNIETVDGIEVSFFFKFLAFEARVEDRDEAHDFEVVVEDDVAFGDVGPV